MFGCRMRWWTPSGALPIECSERNAITMLSLCVNKRSTRGLWSVTLHFFFVLVEKIRKHGSSLTDCAQSLTAHDVGKNLDHAGAVMSDSTPLRCGVGERCCARSEGEHHLHRPKSLDQQGGRRRRLCTCRRPAGNGFSVVVSICSGHVLHLLHRGCRFSW